MKLLRGLLVLLLLVPSALTADVQLPAVFSSNMVLQRETPLPIWGTADPGERVYVTLGAQRAQALTDAHGSWLVTLEPMKAGGPFTLIVSGQTAIERHNVLIGEVWICSGQSNMEWHVRNSANPEEEIAASDDSQLRLLTVPRRVAAAPQKEFESKWVTCSPETIPTFSAVAYYFGRVLRRRLGVPVGLINTSYGGTPAEAWSTSETIAETSELEPLRQRWKQLYADYPKAYEKYQLELTTWEEKKRAATQEGKKPPRRPRRPLGPGHSHQPSGLYNGMVAPLLPYAMRGAIWYQGESNASRAYEYRALFPAMISGWRKAWGQGDFPFYFVQLANFRDVQEDPVESTWAELREAQLMTMSLPNTAMAVIIDIGEAKDIHPKNKQDVGRRLALAALARDYGHNHEHSGPIYCSHEVEDGKIRLSFEHVGSGLETRGGEPLRGFTIAGADRNYVWAKARIDGGQIVVWSDEVAEPVHVRYAWADNPICNLFNKEALPATPFRTDDWPGITSPEAIAAAAAAAQNAAQARGPWPSWRGPNRDAISSEKGLEHNWGENGPPLAWKASGLGKGHASLAIAGDRIFTLGHKEKEKQTVLLAVSTEDGSVLWESPVGGGKPNGTPTVDGDLVYALGRDGDLVCVDVATGAERWRKSFGQDFGGKMMSGWGYCESPLIDGDRLICTPGSPTALLAALDKKTGNVIWKTSAPAAGDRGLDGAGYSSIVITEAAGVRQYVQLVGRGVIAVRANDGEFLWSYDKVANATANIPTPIVKDDYVFCSTGYGAGSALLHIKPAADGRTQAEEVYFLSGKEMQNHHGGMVLVGDHIYCGHGHNNGFPLCIEMKTGKVAWRPGRGPGQGSAAVLYADGHLYFRYENGVVALVQATPEEYVLKGQFTPSSTEDQGWSHPVIANGRLYLRDQDTLLCYRLKG